MSNTATNSNKRLCTGLSSPGDDGKEKIVAATDPVIGLDVCGKVYYCHQSTLVNASPYFASRFSGKFDASIAYVDEKGRNVYFMERPPSTFPYIFDYIVSGGTFVVSRLDPALIRNLQTEAEFFGLEGMFNTTKTFLPGSPGNQGVLYWLGTKKGIAPYRNPFTIGAIHVGGWMEDEKNASQGHYYESAKKTRSSFVHYQERHKIDFDNETRTVSSDPKTSSMVLWCGHGAQRLPVVLDMKSVMLRPTHYSLRTCCCFGMKGDWNFEGSHNGTAWEILHSARSDKSLNLFPGDEDDGTKLKTAMKKVIQEGDTQEDLSDKFFKLVEEEFRHTWELSPPPTEFYRYFRIIGASPVDARRSCLHGEGIELFGEVYEDY